jgi:hypothetical protein
METNQKINGKSSLPDKVANESNGQVCEPNLSEGASVSREQGDESGSSSSRADNDSPELLRSLGNAGLDVKLLCQDSRGLLVGQKSVDESGQLHEIVQQLVECEKNNLAFRKQNYQRSKNRASYGTLLLIVALALFGLGLIVIPAIVSNIIIPFIPVFLLSVAITALARIFLKSHENYCHTEYEQAKNVLDGLGKISQEVLIEPASKDELIVGVQDIIDVSKQILEKQQAIIANLMTDNKGVGIFKNATRTEVSDHDDELASNSDTIISAVPGPSSAY